MNSSAQKWYEQSRSVAERIGEKLEERATSETVFGSPIERGEVTVIPITKVRLGFGGGGGRDEKSESEGGGGGGGIQVTPLGFIEISKGRSVFKRISGVSSFAIAMLLSVFLVLRTSTLKER